ncbi:nucleotide sugar dehydrogenase [Candidatus Margulisiibacteriota bacterium]
MKHDIVVIGGGGHVGLPLALAFANKGKKVAIYDINTKVVKLINSGKMPFDEGGAGQVLKKVINKKLFVYDDPGVIKSAKYVVVVIGTPVDEHLNPKFTAIKKFFLEYLSYFKPGQTIVLRSTVYPGTTDRVADLFKDRKVNINLCFCPERIAEGKAMKEIYELPQIVSGTTKKAETEAIKLFKVICKDVIVIAPMAAELAKLFTNVYRYIHFSIANQFYMMANDYGLDFYKIHEAMTRNYPRAKSFPRPGFTAGPCLFKDTMQLAAFNNYNFFLGHTAMLVNEGLPNYIVSSLKKKENLSKKKVGILGMAFKGDCDDKRESLSYKLKKICEMECKKVYCSDVYITEKGFVEAKELIKKSDIVILGALHKEYKKLNIPKNKLVDIWNFYRKEG